MKNHLFINHNEKLVSLFSDKIEPSQFLADYFSSLCRKFEYYRNLLKPFNSDRCGLNIFNNLPESDKDDYRTTSQREALLLSKNELFTTEYSSGSTSKCVLRICRQEDDNAELKVTEEVFRRTGMNQEDVVVCLEIGSFTIHDFYLRAARNIGVHLNYFIHLTYPYKNAIEQLSNIKPTILLTIPSLFAIIVDEFIEMCNLSNINLKAFIYMGESLPSELRLKIQTHLKCPIYSFYGTTETGGIGGSCKFDPQSIHYNPENILFSLKNPIKLSNEKWRGEAILTTFNVHSQPVLKYRIGDVIELNTNLCKCGETLPRLRFIERTSESFLIAAEKFKYDMFFNTFSSVLPGLDIMNIIINDDLINKNLTILNIVLPLKYEQEKLKILKILKHDIFELDAMYRYGLVDFKIDFKPLSQIVFKKNKKIIDYRSSMK